MQGVAITLISIIFFSLITHDLVEASSPCSDVEAESAFVENPVTESADGFHSQAQHVCHAGHCAFLLCEKAELETSAISRSFFNHFLSSHPKGLAIDLLRPPRV